MPGPARQFQQGEPTETIAKQQFSDSDGSIAFMKKTIGQKLSVIELNSNIWLSGERISKFQICKKEYCTFSVLEVATK